MNNLKVLVTKEKEEPRFRKISINGDVFEFPYFDSLKFTLNLSQNLLTITPYLEKFISMGEVLTIELNENEKVKFMEMCDYHSNGIVYLEELLSLQKVNYKKVFTIDKFNSSIGKEYFSIHIDINEELEDDKVIDLNFILKKLEEVINY